MMAIFEVTIPQMGEGLHEARLVRLLKNVGDMIARDEPIFEMETDKATMEIESPVAGRLSDWLVVADTVVPIGSVVARIQVSDSSAAIITGVGEAEPPGRAGASPARPSAVARNAVVPPRTRAYARERGLSDDDLAGIAATVDGKVMPDDVDRFLDGPAAVPEPPTMGSPDRTAVDVPMSVSQRTLVYRLQQRAREAVPAVEEILVTWAPVDEARGRLKARARQGGPPAPTPFLLFAWCVARASVRHPRFRSTYLGDGVMRVHDCLHLGLAVTRGDDELAMARVGNADTLSFRDFMDAAETAIRRAKAGEDQASDVMQLSLSSLSGSGIERAIPVVVPPAVGTIFLGSPHEVAARRGDQIAMRRAAYVTLTFDHRIVNGVGAGRFLADIRRCIDELGDRLPDEDEQSG